jgi:myo-inositol catabolism protein IolS
MQGKIRFAGVSINDAASGRWLIENGLVDELQVAFNIIEHEVGDEVFPLAAEHGVGILVRMPMARGILTGKFAPGQAVDDYRASLNRDRVPAMIEKAEAIRELAQCAGLTMGQFALRHSITPVGVSAAIPGARSIEQLEQNVAASNGIGLSDAQMAEIAEIQKAW